MLEPDPPPPKRMAPTIVKAMADVIQGTGSLNGEGGTRNGY